MEYQSNFEVPQNLIVENLRNAVANLNDQCIQLTATVQWQSQIIEALKKQLEQINEVHIGQQETTQDQTE